MPKGIILLANGFEDVEAIATIDVLKRAGIDIITISMNDVLDVKTKSNIICKADKLISDINLDDYEFLIIPGGPAVDKVLSKDNRVEKTIIDFEKKDKLICAICAAPSLLNRLGLFVNRKYTCFPGYESNQGKYQNKGVVVDKYITGKSMAYTIDFALAIVSKLLNEEISKKVEKAIFAK